MSRATVKFGRRNSQASELSKHCTSLCRLGEGFVVLSICVLIPVVCLSHYVSYPAIDNSCTTICANCSIFPSEVPVFDFIAILNRTL